MEKTYNPAEALKAQREYQQRTNAPAFAPANGICFNCKQNIYTERQRQYGDRVFSTGITVEKAGSSLVTGCPHCNKSFCD